MSKNRREILQLAGYGSSAALLSPILSQLAAQAEGAPAAELPLRVVFVVQSNGMNPNPLRPEGMEPPKNGRATNDALEETSLQGRQLHRALAGLAPFQDRLTLVQGLSGLQIVLFGGDLLLPEPLFTLIRGLGQGQSLLCRLQLAALL